jgi:hypothetical protein
MSNPIPGMTIHFTTNGKEPKTSSDVYKRHMILRNTTTVRAFAVGQESPASPLIEATFIKIPKNRKITLSTKYAGQYSGGGDLALIDFKRGGGNFRTGSWQGYEGSDLDALIDLGTSQPIKKLALGCLQDQGSWIFMPEKVIFSSSDDGITFQEIAVLTNEISDTLPETRTHDFTIFPKNLKARYIKVQAVNRGTCPVWHPGSGSRAWLFADEVVIE